MNLLETHNITKNYAAHRALDDVSIDVPEQSIFGLLGPNGAGKTTLIRIINQITVYDKGSVLFMDRNLKTDDTNLIGYLPEERGLYKKMKVGEQAMYLAQLKGVSKNDAKIKLKEWFEKFNIYSWWDKKVEELSKGMQQKIQFICTIIHEPKLLIFDEPFSGFDPINTNLIKKEILKLRDEGATIIFSTHNMESVEEICDQIALINNSKKILDGNINDVKKQYSTNTYQLLLSKFNGEIKEIFPANCEIINQKEEKEIFSIKVKLQKEESSNELLKNLINKQINIHSFNEVIPTINEIFIKKVKEDV